MTHTNKKLPEHREASTLAHTEHWAAAFPATSKTAHSTLGRVVPAMVKLCIGRLQHLHVGDRSLVVERVGWNANQSRSTATIFGLPWTALESTTLTRLCIQYSVSDSEDMDQLSFNVYPPTSGNCRRVVIRAQASRVRLSHTCMSVGLPDRRRGQVDVCV